MGQVIGELLPYAAVAAISPIPVIAMIVMLLTPRARSNGLALLIGWVLGLAIVATATFLLVDSGRFSPGSDASENSSTFQLVLGAVLLALGVRRLRARPEPGDQEELPKWLRAADEFNVVKSLGAGLVLSAVNPKALAMSVAAGLAVAAGEESTSTDIVSIAVYVALGSLTMLIPYVLYVTRPEPAQRILGGWKRWLAVHNAAVMATVMLVIGVVLIGKGVAGV